MTEVELIKLRDGFAREVKLNQQIGDLWRNLAQTKMMLETKGF